ncbi:hypothetical protein K1719_017830 [Acacia pycnantha]|nr:hypothetical protein K1719_017830 [Acacia pycnantha]
MGMQYNDNEPVYEGEVLLAEQADKSTPAPSDTRTTDEITPQQGELIKSFLRNNASQLTFYGLFCLQGGLEDRELCVFFRNNHFSTMFKYEGGLYLLATDQGYLNQPDLVWEKLCELMMQEPINLNTLQKWQKWMVVVVMTILVGKVTSLEVEVEKDVDFKVGSGSHKVAVDKGRGVGVVWGMLMVSAGITGGGTVIGSEMSNSEDHVEDMNGESFENMKQRRFRDRSKGSYEEDGAVSDDAASSDSEFSEESDDDDDDEDDVGDVSKWKEFLAERAFLRHTPRLMQLVYGKSTVNSTTVKKEDDSSEDEESEGEFFKPKEEVRKVGHLLPPTTCTSSVHLFQKDN